MKHTKWLLPVVCLTVGALSPLAANAASHEASGKAMMPPTAGSSAMTEGEVKKVDQSAGKVTIKHGPLENLGMPAMTMVFRVKDPAMLGQVKQGDKIRFAADKLNGVYTVTKVEPAK